MRFPPMDWQSGIGLTALGVAAVRCIQVVWVTRIHAQTLKEVASSATKAKFKDKHGETDIEFRDPKAP